MKKRLISWVLILTLVFIGLAPMIGVKAGVSKDGKSYTKVREEAQTAKEVQHGEVAFDKIVYERPDFEKILKDMQAVEAMLSKKPDSEKVLKAYEDIGNKLIDAATALRYASIRNYKDVTDAYYATEVAYVTQGYNVVQNAMIELSEKILESSIGEKAKVAWGDEEIEAIKRAKMLINEKTIALSAKEQELENAYVNATATVTFDVKGTKMTLNQMLSQTDLTYEEQLNYYYNYIDELNKEAGEIFLQLIGVRNQIAKELGFESYVDYSYYGYERDYTAKQAAKLHEHVKDYIVPIYFELAASLTPEDIMYVNSTAGNIAAFDPVIRTFFDEISPDLKESYEYMLKYKLYDFESSPVKSNLSYTSLLYSYHQPYMSITPTGLYTDVSAFIHEFGHYNAFYKHDIDLKLILDIAEMHSQGLEMLFLPYYEAYEGAADSLVKYSFIIYLQTLIQGCLEDEFQQYVYSNDITSVKQLNEEYYKLQLEYGLIPESSDKEVKTWVLITHTFVMPLYYISYATSIVPALEIFEISNVDRKAAIEVYNNLVDAGSKETFLNTLKSVGLGSPFYEGTINKISEAVGDYFNLYEEAVLDPAA